MEMLLMCVSTMHSSFSCHWSKFFHRRQTIRPMLIWLPKLVRQTTFQQLSGVCHGLGESCCVWEGSVVV